MHVLRGICRPPGLTSGSPATSATCTLHHPVCPLTLSFPIPIPSGRSAGHLARPLAHLLRQSPGPATQRTVGLLRPAAGERGGGGGWGAGGGAVMCVGRKGACGSRHHPRLDALSFYPRARGLHRSGSLVGVGKGLFPLRKPGPVSVLTTSYFNAPCIYPPPPPLQMAGACDSNSLPTACRSAGGGDRREGCKRRAGRRGAGRFGRPGIAPLTAMAEVALHDYNVTMMLQP